MALTVPGQFPDPQKAAQDLHDFAKANENRLYKLLKTCVDPQSDVKSIVKASNEFLRRVEQSLESTLFTMTIFLRRATLRIVNQSSIPTLIKGVQKSAPSSKHAQHLLTFISKHCPSLYTPHVSQLTKAIADERNVTLADVGMHALAAVVNANDSQAALDK
jgi:sister-chromatid-cohesion protein PDS5